MNRILAFLVAFGLFIGEAEAAYQGTPPEVVPNGGTGQVSFTAHGPIVGEGTAGLGIVAPVAGSVLYQSSAGSDPVMSITPALGVASTSAGTLTFNNSTTAFGATIQALGITPASYNFNLPLTAGTNGQLLTSGGGGSAAMTWSNGAIAPSVATTSGSGATQTLATTNNLYTISNITVSAVWSLPAIQAAGWVECLKDGTTNFASHSQTVKPNPTSLTIDNIAGTTGVVLQQQGQGQCFLSDGTNWFSI